MGFASPLKEKDRQDLRWYVETYGAAWSDEPDDVEAQRIEARLPEIGSALFNAVSQPKLTRTRTTNRELQREGVAVARFIFLPSIFLPDTSFRR